LGILSPMAYWTQINQRGHLAQAEQHVAEAEAKIARQRQLIEQLRQDGHETDLAESMRDYPGRALLPLRASGHRISF
jgi:hypothetical protein